MIAEAKIKGNLLLMSWIPPKEIRESRDLVRGNIFTKAGKEWLRNLKIPAIEIYLSIMEKLDEEIKKMDKRLREEEYTFP